MGSREPCPRQPPQPRTRGQDHMRRVSTHEGVIAGSYTRKVAAVCVGKLRRPAAVGTLVSRVHDRRASSDPVAMSVGNAYSWGCWTKLQAAPESRCLHAADNFAGRLRQLPCVYARPDWSSRRCGARRSRSHQTSSLFFAKRHRAQQACSMPPAARHAPPKRASLQASASRG